VLSVFPLARAHRHHAYRHARFGPTLAREVDLGHLSLDPPVGGPVDAALARGGQCRDGVARLFKVLEYPSEYVRTSEQVLEYPAEHVRISEQVLEYPAEHVRTLEQVLEYPSEHVRTLEKVLEYLFGVVDVSNEVLEYLAGLEGFPEGYSSTFRRGRPVPPRSRGRIHRGLGATTRPR
jgi:hypothetical protein